MSGKVQKPGSQSHAFKKPLIVGASIELIAYSTYPVSSWHVLGS